MFLDPSLSSTMTIGRTMCCDGSVERTQDLQPGAAVILTVLVGVLVWVGLIGWAVA